MSNIILSWFPAVIAIVVAIDEQNLNNHGSSDIIKAFPYLVGLAVADGNENINQTVCSGTLVSPNFVLTSAYCTSLLQSKKIKVLSRKSATVTKKRLVIKIYAHPSYDPALRLFDLSLVKLRPFKHVTRFVNLSSKIFNNDVDLDCVVVGIRGPDGSSYKAPVRAKYGRYACQVPKSKPILKNILGYTWTDFLCIQTVGPLFPYLPCGRSDPLLCGHDSQYGIFSYGYDMDDTSNSESISFLNSNYESELIECSDPIMQSRSLFVNKHYEWIAETMSGKTEDGVSVNFGTIKVSVKTANEIGVRSFNVTSAITRTSTHSTPKLSTLTDRFKSAQNFVSNPDDFPYLVHLQGLADEPACGGTLISPTHVLTSAYCTTRMTEIHVTAAYRGHLHTNGNVVYVHPDFDVKSLTADVSVVILRDPFDVSKYAEIADFPEPPGANETAAMSCAVVAKMPTAPYYYHASVKAKYGPGACRKAVVSEIQTTVDRTWREFVCGWSDSRLKEDTGNPLICDGMQYGVISHTYQIVHPNENVTEQMRFLALKNYKWWITDVVTETRRLEAAATGVKDRQCGLTTVVVALVLSDAVRRLWISP